jgi:DNA-binding MarR family transcriptional regulator
VPSQSARHKLSVEVEVEDGELEAVAVALERVTSWLRAATRPEEWSTTALSTLDLLSRSGPLRVTDLVARERITQPGMTGLVTRLTRARLASRRADPTDGRATLVEITDAGRRYLRKRHEQRAAVLAEHLRNLPADQQRLLVSAVAPLDRLAGQPVSTSTSPERS